eukprot:GHVU01126786.1.p1 GENE.GHVU01126786.1~~GHVU01126786.1.p1  ORF type:complete len:254 (-),score=79.98 GHVU01126786.1:98-859(-)
MNALGRVEKDPYDEAEAAVKVHLSKCQRLHDEWQRSLGDPAAAHLGEESLLRELQQLEADVGDLDRCVEAVEVNQDRFNIPTTVIQARKNFLMKTQRSANTMRTAMQAAKRTMLLRSNGTGAGGGGGAGGAGGGGGGRSVSTTAAAASSRQEFVSAQRGHQQMLIEQQDVQLEELSKTAEQLNRHAVVINSELEDQKRMLVELDEDMEHQQEKMNFVMRRMSGLLKTNNVKTLWLVLILIGILFIMVFLVLYI